MTDEIPLPSAESLELAEPSQEADSDSDLPTSDGCDEFEERLAAVEQQLAKAIDRNIGQEHRVLSIVHDFRSHKGDSSRRWLSVLAFARWLFSVIGRPIAATSAGVAAFMGLYLAYEANQKLEEQNEKFEEQNGLARAQIALVAKQNQFFQRQIEQGAVQDFRVRRAQLLATLYDTRPCNDEDGMCPVSSCRARGEAAVTLVRIENAVRTDRKEDKSRWPGVVVDRVTNLAMVVLDGCQLRRADLSGADLSGADLSRSDLSHADLSYADLSKTKIGRANLDSANLEKSNLNDANFNGAELINASFMYAKLRGSSLRGADLSRANLSRATLVEVDFTNADLTLASLAGADLRGASLAGADLRGANLTDTDLSGADLSGADLIDANFAYFKSGKGFLNPVHGLTSEQLESAKNVPDEAWELVGGDRPQEVE